jgi:Questin oxidase-like
MAPPRIADAPALLAWLDAGAGYHAEYGNGLSNHLPMALCALHRLGADAARLRTFATGYATQLRPAPAAQAWPAVDAWASRLGDPAAWPAYRHLFGEWLHHEGGPDVLNAVLPRLMQGCGGAAFHGLIRTAYAVQTAHVRELADALAHWACSWADLGPLPDVPASEADPAAALRRLPLPARPLAGRLILHRVAAAAALPGFAAGVAQLKVDEHTLERLARGSAELYAASGNFTVLHMLTSAHALRVLLPWLDEPLPAVRAYWQAFAAAWLASGARDRGPARLRAWPQIVAFAVASDDEHVIKLVDSCREQERACGGDVWRRAASRVLATG